MTAPLQFAVAASMLAPGLISLADVNFGAGLKYMFPRGFAFNLPRDAYNEWCNTVRWKWHMRNKVEKDFAPELLIRSDSIADEAPQYIENGLMKGRVQLEQQLERIQNEVVYQRLPYAVDKQKACQLLTELNLILVPSDKNLGCALITKDWYLEQAMVHLSNVNSYRKVEQNEAIEFINEQAMACEALGFHPYVCTRENGKILRSQKSKWIIQYVEKLKKDATPVLLATPRFYVIPKIHKSPWKGRPIVPAHSAVHSPAAKLTSMMLKPLVKRQPYIIHGSKDFIQKVSQIRWFREEKSRIFIVGGDIEAYYPNVPKGRASQIVKEMMDQDPRQSENDFGSFFEECLDTADKTVVMRFQDDWYIQTDGLSMGVAHAPDMANLYGSYFENQIIPTLGEDILYYGRYIDDVFFVVRANNAETASKLCKNLIIEGVNIVWEPPKQYGVFLDVRLWIGDNTLEFRPHRKDGNHLERVPWISAHPLDVKKGTFMGELSRLATLCSNDVLYYEACIDLRSLYIRRGYPVNLVKSWYNTYAGSFWRDRFLEKPPQRDVQVLRSTFNPIWEYVSISDIQDAVSKQWEKDAHWRELFGGESDLPPGMVKPLIVGRKRTKNLGDLVAKMRKVVLNYNDVSEELGREVTDAWKS
ncbi:hypothetical protein RSAG8_13767, partial [Rhizoctonia solani AG-8 WAC10335]